MTPFVLIPGFSCTGDVFRYALSALWPNGAVHIANPGPTDTVEDAARAVLDQAPPRFGLLGFSMGGYIALEIMRQAPERVTRLCMLSSMARPDSPDEFEKRQQTLEFAARHSFEEVLDRAFPKTLPDDRTIDTDLRALHRSYASEIGKTIFIEHLKMIRDRPDSRPDLSRMAQPVSLIVGDRDRICTPDDAREMAALFPNHQLEIIPDAGHFALIERHDPVAAALGRWAIQP